MRTSGVGFLAMTLLAIDQIFCFAPSISPPMEPVESSTNATSTRGLAGGGVGAGADSGDGEPPRAAPRCRDALSCTVLLHGFTSGPGERVVDDDVDVVPEGEPRGSLGDDSSSSAKYSSLPNRTVRFLSPASACAVESVHAVPFW